VDHCVGPPFEDIPLRHDCVGVERLKDVIAGNATDALPALAEKILGAARGFGAQFDDQTILLVRRV
jgi:hypothetical protein